MTHLIVAAGAVFAAMIVLWLLSLALRDSSIVDIAWGPVIALGPLLGLYFAAGWWPRRLLLAVLVCVWALRLAGHIALKQRGHGEDPRYAAWRAQYGGGWGRRSLWHVFLLQGAIALIVSAPLFVAQQATLPTAFTTLDALAAAVWLAGLLFESIADAQLLRFTRHRRPGEILTRGLWRYSRHPNYFGEALLWWGLGLFALHVRWGFLALIGPALINFLLVRVSGVRMTEERMADRPGYAEYVRSTSAFIPLPPRS